MTRTLMQGLGNTFVVFSGPLQLSSDEVIRYCTEASVDGLLVVAPIDDSSVEMKYWNNDGSPAEMCGNGLRCAARYAVDNGYVAPGQFAVKTDAGILKAIWDGDDSTDIEVQVGKVTCEDDAVTISGVPCFVANVGNPHAVIFVDDIQSAPVDSLGPRIENDAHFANRTNVEFVEVMSPWVIKARIWERGVGETQACGTGMVAAVAVGAKLAELIAPVQVCVPGGKATVWTDEDGYSRMRAPASYM